MQKDDEKVNSEELREIRKQIKARGKIRKEKQVTNEENVSPPQLRRSSRLRGLVKKTSSKGTKFINLDEETLEPSPVNISSTHSPQNSPIHHFEGSLSIRSIGMDLVQQQIYDYIESLEKRSASVNAKPSANPQEPLIDALKQEIYELDILNKHIKRENETLKEQNNWTRQFTIIPFCI